MMGFLPLLLASLVMFSADNAIGTSQEVEKDIAAVEQPIDEAAFSVVSSICTNVKKFIGDSYEELESKNREPDVDELTLDYINHISNVSIYYNITTAAAQIPLAQEFNPNQTLHIFIPGFTDDPSTGSFIAISDALLSKGESNVLALNASSLIGSWYLRSTTYVRFIGEKLGGVLADMVNNGVNSSAIYLIGHSLGAHVAAFAGKTFANLTGLNVRRITGLDPAGPCFADVKPELRLKATDADYVDVIHTDAGVYGLKYPCGQVDYFPNSGSEQPNCTSQSCSHSRAWEYYAESVGSPDAFLALRCDDYEAFEEGQCNGTASPMGFASEPGTKGLYYLQTGGDSPYGLGENGTKWRNVE